ncbi:MAG: RNA polymerase factor sigma-54 [Lachnospiraceae bacterium]|nr:RNA polymerase factor sigma-54 [Lachnospiraceae bacterium]
MNYSQSIHARQEQKKTFSPSLLRSFQLLNFSYPALVSFLEKHCLENPFLEFHSAEIAESVPFEEKEIYKERGDRMDPVPLFRSADALDSLDEHLRIQLLSSDAPTDVIRAGLRIIEYIDERGYCRESPEDIAAYEKLSVKATRAALDLIKTFSPRGVGAADLRECLLLQADPGLCKPDILQAILSAPIQALESGDWQRLAAIAGCDIAEIREHIAYLSTLSPYPGSGFDSGTPTPYTYPEIEIKSDGEQLSFSFRSGCELITVDAALFETLSDQAAGDPEASQYISARFREANELVNELKLRRHVVEMLIVYIIKEQTDYFTLPEGPLKPITMRMAAAALGVHPSTISRCVSGRYICTPRGTLPMKALFSSGYVSDSGTAVSSVEIKRLLRRMISGESPANPLSDLELTAKFAADGIRLSRRTVAKYREQLGIPGSRVRRRKGEILNEHK